MLRRLACIPLRGMAAKACSFYGVGVLSRVVRVRARRGSERRGGGLGFEGVESLGSRAGDPVCVSLSRPSCSPPAPPRTPLEEAPNADLEPPPKLLPQ